MSKVLFLPFLQIPSGHHQVVTTMTHQLQKSNYPIEWEKVDILSYSYKYIEPLVSSIYLKWIELFPDVYHWLYQKSVYESLEEEKDFKLYEVLFLRSMKKLLRSYKPSHIVCSHALPSYLVSKLKKQGVCEAKLINVYTDYFIHHIWGTAHVDAHFISLPSMKEYLLNKGVKEQNIYYTGIPVHDEFQNFTKQGVHSVKNLDLLITGGSLGVGQLNRLFNKLPKHGNIHYHVLCGNNKKLWNQLTIMSHPRITPYSYISCKKQLNLLYDSIHAVLTKPGGITVSECLVKRKPIIIYDHLPGQEKINVNALKELGLVHILPIKDDISIYEGQLNDLFSSHHFLTRHKERLDKYQNSLQKVSPVDLIISGY